jgi:hypothetical protein
MNSAHMNQLKCECTNTRDYWGLTAKAFFILSVRAWVALLNDLRALAKRLRRKKRQTEEAELKFLEGYQDRMDYAAARPAGKPQGSGAMESTCR